MNNYQVVDLDELEDVESSVTISKAPSFQFKALCTSQLCCGRKEGIEKNVGRSAENCPDCGDFLFWSRKAVA